VIKKLVYTGGTNNLNTEHKKAMAHMNMMNLYQDRLWDIQDFRDQYMAMREVCNKLELKFSRCTSDTKEILKEKRTTSPNQAQLKKAVDEVKEEHHVI